MILEIIIVGISLNLVWGCGEVGTSKINGKKKKNKIYSLEFQNVINYIKNVKIDKKNLNIPRNYFNNHSKMISPATSFPPFDLPTTLLMLTAAYFLYKYHQSSNELDLLEHMEKSRKC